MTSVATTRLLEYPTMDQNRADTSDGLNVSAMSVTEEQRVWLQSLIDRLEGQLLRYAYSLTRDLDAARDAVQETFLRACGEPKASLEGHEAAWLFRVCRSRAMDHHRKEKRISIAMDIDLHALPAASGSDSLVEQETSSKILVLLAALPESQQEVIRLKFQNNLSYREISEVTGLSVSNVGVQLHHGLRQLRKQLSGE